MHSDGPSVVITGASTGIGKATALYLDTLGLRVFAGVRKETDGRALIREAPGRLTPILIDVTDGNSIAAAVDAVSAETSGMLSGLVNDAGLSLNGPLELVPVSKIKKLMEVNVIGLLAVTKAFLPLIRKGRGRIVNISSGHGLLAIRNTPTRHPNLRCRPSATRYVSSFSPLGLESVSRGRQSRDRGARKDPRRPGGHGPGRRPRNPRALRSSDRFLRPRGQGSAGSRSSGGGEGGCQIADHHQTEGAYPDWARCEKDEKPRPASGEDAGSALVRGPLLGEGVMSALEIIHLRSSSEPIENLADRIRESLWDDGRTDGVFTIYRRNGLATDLAVHIRCDGNTPRCRRLGLQLVASLSVYGLVEHSVWHEMAPPRRTTMLELALRSSHRYWTWLIFLTLLISGAVAMFVLQNTVGLTVTAMGRIMPWGFTSPNSLFSSGSPHRRWWWFSPTDPHDVREFGRLTIFGEFLAIPAVTVKREALQRYDGAPMNHHQQHGPIPDGESP